jgi:mono/diheme cytochrome c family protein
MKNFLKVIAFSVFAIAFYALFVEFYVPSIERPAVTGGGIMALGERIYNRSCVPCHDKMGQRAPDLSRIAEVAETRLKDPGYRGRATDGYGYIMESMTEPSAYVVSGYGAIGTRDAVSPMPNAAKPPMGLTDEELGAIAAYLLSLAGIDTTGK